MNFRRTSRTGWIGMGLLLCTLLPGVAHATPLAPFIDLQEKGLTVSAAGVGTMGWNGSPRNLNLNVGGTVRFALLYWAGRQRPCEESSPGVCITPVGIYRDQQILFDGNAITGTLIGTEAQPVSGGGPILNVGYYADVTAIVAGKGTGPQTFTFADGNLSSNLWRLDGAGLLVAYTDASNSSWYRVIVWDGLDLAYGPDPTPGPTRVTDPANINHGINLSDRDGDLWLLMGDGTADRPDNVTISNNATLFNTLDGSDGAQWDAEHQPLHVPAGVGTTTVQVNSAPNNQNPDSLLWEVVAIRLPALDVAPAQCPVNFVTGPPKQAVVTIRDVGTGLSSVVVTKSENSDTPVPPFTVGTTDPLVVTSTKIDQTKSSRVEIIVTDLAGNRAVCDPIQTTLGDADQQLGQNEGDGSQTFQDVPHQENKVSIVNGAPGLKSVTVLVNGVKFKTENLRDGAKVTLDITSALHYGSNNVVTLKGKGKDGGTAEVFIWDGNGQL
jgi:hypothetical protein